MKFMITWQFHQGKLDEGYSDFFKMTPEQDATDRGSIKLIGRWHDLARGRGVAICESDSAEALASWALNWNSLLDADVVPVLDDKAARALGKSREERNTSSRDPKKDFFRARKSEESKKAEQRLA